MRKPNCFAGPTTLFPRMICRDNWPLPLAFCCRGLLVVCVVESVFCCCCCIPRRAFLQLAPLERSQAVDVLAANLRALCASAQVLLSDEEPASLEALQRHRNGLKMIVHLLHIIAVQAHKESEQAKGAENAAAKPVKAAGTQWTLLLGRCCRAHFPTVRTAWACVVWGFCMGPCVVVLTPCSQLCASI